MNDGGGDTTPGDGAVILTETKMILVCSRANRSGSAADSIHSFRPTGECKALSAS